MSDCTLCPRMCHIDRSAGALGFCGEAAEMRIARAALHPFEEPCLSGTRGSGTIFFCGCSLRCVFCQNREISRASATGRAVSEGELGEIILDLQEQGAHNVNFVTPTHFTDGIRRTLERVRDKLTIPVVWISSGYERVETLRTLDGLVDIYLPDFKYYSSELARAYSSAPDYREVASAALLEMFRQTGRYALDGDGLLLRGVLVRHLVLPAARKDSMAALDHLAALLPTEEILLSLMSQYTPDFALDSPYRSLHRRVTTFEYDTVLRHAADLGFVGFMQEKSSASSVYTPKF